MEDNKKLALAKEMGDNRYVEYYNALKGHGATVRLVMLPAESHGYASRESILHVLWESDQWLMKYVKNKK